MKKLTQYEELRLISEANRLLICKLLRFSDEDMFEMVWTEGMRYLENQCMGHKASIQLMQSDFFYWHWWTTHWNTRNEEFIANHELKDTDSYNDDEIWRLRNAFSYRHTKGIHGEELCKSYMYAMEEMTKKVSQEIPKKQAV